MEVSGTRGLMVSLGTSSTLSTYLVCGALGNSSFRAVAAGPSPRPLTSSGIEGNKTVLQQISAGGSNYEMWADAYLDLAVVRVSDRRRLSVLYLVFEHGVRINK